VEVELADSLHNGWNHWLAWEELQIAHGLSREDTIDGQTVSIHGGKRLGFTRVIARKS